MKRQQFIDSLCKSLRLAELSPDENGIYAIVFDGNVEIEILPLTETRLLLRSRLGSLPEDEQEHEAFLRGIMQRNMANLHSQQGAITIDRDGRGLWLFRPVETTPLDDRSVVELVENFVNLADWWGQSETASSNLGPNLGGLPFQMMRP